MTDILHICGTYCAGKVETVCRILIYWYPLEISKYEKKIHKIEADMKSIQ